MKAEFVSPAAEPEPAAATTGGSALGSGDGDVAAAPSPMRRRIDLLHAEILDNDSEEEA